MDTVARASELAQEAIELYLDDRLDACLQKIREAFALAPEYAKSGTWHRFFLEATLERDAQQLCSRFIHSNWLTIKMELALTGSLLPALREACDLGSARFAELLGFHPHRSLVITLFPKGSCRKAGYTRGYAAFKRTYDQICLHPNRTPDKLKVALVHEYTHVVIHHLTGDRCPIWMGEGAAIYFSDTWAGQNGWERFWNWIATGRTILPLTDAERQIYHPSRSEDFWTPNGDTWFAYGVCYRAFKYLFEDYGEDIVRRLMHEFGGGATVEEAFQRQVGKSLREFEDEWRRAEGVDN